MVEQGRAAVDAAFAEAAKRLRGKAGRQPLTPERVESIRASLRWNRWNRWAAAAASAVALGGEAAGVSRDRDTQTISAARLDKMDKWLGNSVRDYLQFQVYDVGLQSLADGSRKAGEILEDLRARIDDLLDRYGLPSHRGADRSVVDDLREVLGLLTAEGGN